MGFSVAEAGGSQEALDLITGQSFDAALVDYMMPGMNGIETLKRIRDVSPETAVSIITAFGSVDKADRRKKAAEMTGRFIRKHKSKFQGVHIMPLGWTDIVPDILREAEVTV